MLSHLLRGRHRVWPVTPFAFGFTPKAFANFSPGLERSEQPWEYKFNGIKR